MGAAVQCPDENHLVGLIEGRLSEEHLEQLEDHIDSCRSCGRLLDELAEVIVPSATTANEQCVGRYQVLEEVGAGAMGVVYAAFDPDLRRKVALKLLRPDLALVTDLPAARARLLREARLHASLTHPNVVTVFDVGSYGEDVFIAFELIEGHSFAEVFGDRADWLRVVEAYAQAARGLAAAHEAGLVHRDVKPANLMLRADGRVCVTDFGLATAVGGEASGIRPQSRLGTSLATQSGAIVGTPAYMAPEQYAGGKVDHRADQYAFCVSLGEALSGSRPGAGAQVDDLREAVEAGDGEPVPTELLLIVERGVRPRPVDRFAGMSELADALEAVATSDRLPEPSALLPRRGAAVIGVAVALLALALVAQWAVGDSSPETMPASIAEPAPDEVAPLAPSEQDDAEPTPAEARASGSNGWPPSPTIASAPAGLPPDPQRASRMLSSARRKADDGDGPGCLADLLVVERNDSMLAQRQDVRKVRATCEMFAGDCASGRRHIAAMFKGRAKTQQELDRLVDANSIAACRKAQPEPPVSSAGSKHRDKLSAWLTQARQALAAKDVARCRSVAAATNAYVASQKLARDPVLKLDAASVLSVTERCLADSSSCAEAKRSHEARYRKLHPELMTPDEYDRNLDQMFYSAYPQCAP